MQPEKTGIIANYIMLITQTAALYIMGLGYALFYSKIYEGLPVSYYVLTSILITYISGRFSGILHQRIYHYKIDNLQSILRKKIELNFLASFINLVIIVVLLVFISPILFQSLRSILEYFFLIVWFYFSYIFFTAGQIGLMIGFLSKWNEAKGDKNYILVSRIFILVWSISAIVAAVVNSVLVINEKNIKLF